MTADQLRRLATARTREAGELVVDANRLRSQASALSGLLDPLVPMSQRVWIGPAASDFESQVQEHSGRLRNQAAILDRIANDFEQLAAAKRREAAQLQVRAAASEASISGGVI